MVIPKEVISYLEEISRQTNIIDNEEFEQIIANGEIEQYLILDIRERELFQKFRFPNSINIPFKELGKNLNRIPSDRKIMIICNSGFTAAQSLSLLNSIGYKTCILKDGINGYLEEGKNAKNNILRTA
ncbi:MAG: hypothetical protein PWQ67_825 [Clostridia bacterium]|jgi:methyl-accepting chemotaxis protein|nr:hypothetical protein [Clostridia bacterium]MDN5322371.1 hypothetical protein [Clostridia bacterium]